MGRKPTTWSIKGIEEDTRDIARAAAERDEQTIGSWIDYAIRVHGGQRPRETVDDEAATETAPAKIDSQHADRHPSAPGLSDSAVLDIIDRELDASTSRLDRALRPMGLALLDLAERMVSVEQSQLGQWPTGSTPHRRQLERVEDRFEGHGSNAIAEDDFGPELPPQALDEEPEEPEERVDPTAPADEPLEDDREPSPPSHDLAPEIDGLDVPMLPVEQTDRAREIDRRLRALAGQVDAIDALDADAPPPPTGDLGPSAIVIDAKVAEAETVPDLELPMAFRGLQKSGFDTDAIAAVDEDSRDARQQRGRKFRRTLLGTTGLAAVLVAGLYFFAGQLGLGPLRDTLQSRLEPAAHHIADGATHLWQQTERHIAPMIEHAKTALLGGDRPEAPEREDIMDDAVEASPPAAGPAQPVQPGSGQSSEQMSSVPDSMGQKADPALSNEAEPELSSDAEDDVPQTVEPAATEPDTVALLSAEDTAPPSEIAIAPPPAQSERPVPVPDAAPAPKVSEAPPPPAPALPAPRSNDLAEAGKSPSPAAGSQRSEWQSLERRADAGDAKAQHDLALAYLTGATGSENPERAAELLREAAIQGLPAAQYNLAVLYETGQGVRQDDVRALLWYHSAAEQGHPNAQYNLGVMYAEGRGIPLNFGEAARWFQAAANQGMSRALYNLAILTDEGLGVKQDKEKALELFRAAADAGDQRAIEMLSGDVEARESEAGLTGADGVRASNDASAAIVAGVQRELARLGIYAGRVDGLIGPKTRAAIRDFEQSVGIEQSGEATTALLEKLKAAKP